MNELLENLNSFIVNTTWITPFIVFLAGILTSFSPCSLSSIPLSMAYITGTSKNTKKAFHYSILIAIGMAISFSIMGIIAMMLGQLIGKSSSIWFIIIGVLMILMTLQLWEIHEFIPATYLNGKFMKKGWIGAILVGLLTGVFSSPCATPIIVVILSIIANSNDFMNGFSLLLLYSLGNSIIIILFGTFTGFVKKIATSNKYGVFSKISKFVLGAIALVFALYMFYLGF